MCGKCNSRFDSSDTLRLHLIECKENLGVSCLLMLFVVVDLRYEIRLRHSDVLQMVPWGGSRRMVLPLSCFGYVCG